MLQTSCRTAVSSIWVALHLAKHTREHVHLGSGLSWKWSDWKISNWKKSRKNKKPTIQKLEQLIDFIDVLKRCRLFFFVPRVWDMLRTCFKWPMFFIGAMVAGVFFSPPESPTNYPPSIGMDATVPKASERYDSFRWSWGLGGWHWGGRMPILSQVFCWAVAFYGCVPLYAFELPISTGSLGSRIFLKKPVDQIQENLFVIALGTCRHVAYKSAQVCMHNLKDFFVDKT